MGLSFLTPIIFAGLGLLVVPYIVHQIHKPEREAYRFSSLMFVPKVTHDVVERKRIQHPWLMLLRMLALVLLTLAFTRPYWKALASNQPQEVAIQHLILLDTSYGMGLGETFDEAKAAAKEVLADIDSDEGVGVVYFNLDADIIVPLEKAEANHARALKAIDDAQLSQGHTNYARSLQTAYRHATGVIDGPVQMHVVSDFRQSGRRSGASKWKLPSHFELNTVSVGSDETANFGLGELGVRRYPNGELRVMVKAHNWSDARIEDMSVYLELNGQVIQENILSLRPGMSRQTSFRFTPKSDQTFMGRVWIHDESVQQDNERFFAWNAPQTRDILIVQDTEGSSRWPAHRFFKQALNSMAGPPWKIHAVSSEDFGSQWGAGEFDLVLLCTTKGLSTGDTKQLLTYVESGGRLLISADTEGDILDSLGVYRVPSSEKRSVPAQISWVDLGHPVFSLFQASQYNDFSSVQFMQYVSVDLEKSNPRLTSLAQLDNGAPIILEGQMGKGHYFVWLFQNRLEWTSLAKNPRFVPMLQESIDYLTLHDEFPLSYTIGEKPHWENEPLVEVGYISADSQRSIDTPIVCAVNVDAYEGDMTPMSEEVFQLTYSVAGIGRDEQVPQSTGYGLVDHDGNAIYSEYGLWALGLVLMVLLIEFFYMSALSKEVRNV